MTAPERPAGSEASDLGRFEPTAYDLGITDDPGPQCPSQADLWAAQNAPRIASAAGCTDAEYERLLGARQQAEAAYLARWGSLAPEPRTEAELAAEARREAWGPQSPVPYLLTPAAEAALDDGAECGADRADCRAWLGDLGPEHDGALVYDVPLPCTPVQPGPYPDPSDPERLAERLGFTSAAAMCAAYEAYADDLAARAAAEPEAEL